MKIKTVLAIAFIIVASSSMSFAQKSLDNQKNKQTGISIKPCEVSIHLYNGNRYVDLLTISDAYQQIGWSKAYTGNSNCTFYVMANPHELSASAILSNSNYIASGGNIPHTLTENSDGSFFVHFHVTIEQVK